MFTDSKKHPTFTKRGEPVEQRKQLGYQGESLVARYLQQQGFEIVHQNFYTRFGEIDIIARQQNLIIFVEVKTRTHHYFNLSEVITRAKQRSIIKTAEHYIVQQKYRAHSFRFDVALIEGEGAQNSITYIPNAFTKPETVY